jgi:hypothetical protein
MDAAALFAAGNRIYEAAEQIGVAYEATHCWKSLSQKDGVAAVRSRHRGNEGVRWHGGPETVIGNKGGDPCHGKRPLRHLTDSRLCPELRRAGKGRSKPHVLPRVSTSDLPDPNSKVAGATLGPPAE